MFIAIAIITDFLIFFTVGFLFLSGGRSNLMNFEARIALLDLYYAQRIYDSTPDDHTDKERMSEQLKSAKDWAFEIIEKKYPIWSGWRPKFERTRPRLDHPHALIRLVK